VYGKDKIDLELRKVLVYDINLKNKAWRVDRRTLIYFNLTIPIEIGEDENEWSYTSTVPIYLCDVNRDIKCLLIIIYFLVAYG
jgi:hypothetical protein